MTWEEYKQRVEREAKEFAQQFSKFVNEMAADEKLGIATDCMLRDHPTLQQGMMRFCLLYICKMAKQREGDLRNADSISLAKAIIERTTDMDRALRHI